jgi:rubrerythrin
MSEKPHKELLDMISRAIKIEAKAIELYERTAKTVTNAAVRLLIEELGMDSAKHKKMYQTVERVLKETPYSFKDFDESRWIDKEVAKRDLKEHIEVEKHMIELLEGQIKNVKQPTIKAIFEHIYEDEQRHHKILMKVIGGL